MLSNLKELIFDIFLLGNQIEANDISNYKKIPADYENGELFQRLVIELKDGNEITIRI